MQNELTKIITGLQLPLLDDRHQQPDAHDGGSHKTDDSDYSILDLAGRLQRFETLEFAEVREDGTLTVMVWEIMEGPRANATTIDTTHQANKVAAV